MDTYRGNTFVGCDVWPEDFTEGTELANVKSQGCNFLAFRELRLTNYLPTSVGAVTSPSQVAPTDSWAAMDSFAAFASTNKIFVMLSFDSLADYAVGTGSDGGSLTTPAWMIETVGSLTNANMAQLEEYYYANNSIVSTVTTSIKCLWEAIAARYASNPYLIFNFFNEPENTGNWGNWLNTYATSSSPENYATCMAALVDAVRGVSGNSNRIIVIDYSWGDMNWGIVDVPRDIIWDCHPYIVGGSSYPSLASWEALVNSYVSQIVTGLSKPLIFAEYSVMDSNYTPATDFSDSVTSAAWYTDLAAMVAYMQTLPIVGYSWYTHGFLYGEYANPSGTSPLYSAVNSEFILGENPAGYPTFSGIFTGAVTGGETSISLSPTSGVVGTVVTISGSGFADSSAITAKFNGSSISLSGTTTTSGGAIPSGVTFAVPSLAADSYSVMVSDTVGNSASAVFTVLALPSGGSIVVVSSPTGTMNCYEAGYAILALMQYGGSSYYSQVQNILDLWASLQNSDGSWYEQYNPYSPYAVVTETSEGTDGNLKVDSGAALIAWAMSNYDRLTSGTRYKANVQLALNFLRALQYSHTVAYLTNLIANLILDGTTDNTALLADCGECLLSAKFAMDAYGSSLLTTSGYSVQTFANNLYYSIAVTGWRGNTAQYYDTSYPYGQNSNVPFNYQEKLSYTQALCSWAVYVFAKSAYQTAGDYSSQCEICLSYINTLTHGSWGGEYYCPYTGATGQTQNEYSGYAALMAIACQTVDSVTYASLIAGLISFIKWLTLPGGQVCDMVDVTGRVWRSQIGTTEDGFLILPIALALLAGAGT